jgi:hypothetical protein
MNCDNWVCEFEKDCIELVLKKEQLIPILQSGQDEPDSFYTRRLNRHRRKLAIKNGKYFSKNNNTFIPLSNL